MAEFKLNSNGIVTIKVQALNAYVISGGFIKLVAPTTGSSVPGARPSVGIIEWQVPANDQAVYTLIVQLPRQASLPLKNHKLRRKISQQTSGGSVDLPSPSGNPKNTHPNVSLPGNQILYTEIIKFRS